MTSLKLSDFVGDARAPRNPDERIQMVLEAVQFIFGALRSDNPMDELRAVLDPVAASRFENDDETLIAELKTSVSSWLNIRDPDAYSTSRFVKKNPLSEALQMPSDVLIGKLKPFKVEPEDFVYSVVGDVAIVYEIGGISALDFTNWIAEPSETADEYYDFLNQLPEPSRKQSVRNDLGKIAMKLLFAPLENLPEKKIKKKIPKQPEVPKVKQPEAPKIKKRLEPKSKKPEAPKSKQPDIPDISDAEQPFSELYPLEFDLVDGLEQPSFAGLARDGQSMALKITNTARNDLTFDPINDDQRCHLAIRIPRGVLKSDKINGIRLVGDNTNFWDLKQEPWRSPQQDSRTAVNGVRRFDALYLTRSDGAALSPDASWMIELDKVVADGSRGSRTTRIEFDYTGLTYRGRQLSGTRTKAMSVVNGTTPGVQIDLEKIKADLEKQRIEHRKESEKTKKEAQKSLDRIKHNFDEKTKADHESTFTFRTHTNQQIKKLSEKLETLEQELNDARANLEQLLQHEKPLKIAAKTFTNGFWQDERVMLPDAECKIGLSIVNVGEDLTFHPSSAYDEIGHSRLIIGLEIDPEGEDLPSTLCGHGQIQAITPQLDGFALEHGSWPKTRETRTEWSLVPNETLTLEANEYLHLWIDDVRTKSISNAHDAYQFKTKITLRWENLHLQDATMVQDDEVYYELLKTNQTGFQTGKTQSGQQVSSLRTQGDTPLMIGRNPQKFNKKQKSGSSLLVGGRTVSDNILTHEVETKTLNANGIETGTLNTDSLDVTKGLKAHGQTTLDRAEIRSLQRQSPAEGPSRPYFQVHHNKVEGDFIALESGERVEDFDIILAPTQFGLVEKAGWTHDNAMMMMMTNAIEDQRDGTAGWWIVARYLMTLEVGRGDKNLLGWVGKYEDDDPRLEKARKMLGPEMAKFSRNCGLLNRPQDFSKSDADDAFDTLTDEEAYGWGEYTPQDMLDIVFDDPHYIHRFLMKVSVFVIPKSLSKSE